MSKLKSLVLSIALTIWAVSLFALQQLVPSLVILGLAALFFSLWLYKYLRDRSIIAQARLERANPAPTLPAPSITSKGSRRLFVPQPIDK